MTQPVFSATIDRRRGARALWPVRSLRRASRAGWFDRLACADSTRRRKPARPEPTPRNPTREVEDYAGQGAVRPAAAGGKARGSSQARPMNDASGRA